MKKLFVLFFILFCGLLFSQDFRQVKWGMTKDEVKKSETSGNIDTDLTNDSALKYNNIKLNDYPFELIYNFDKNNKLYYGFYDFRYENVNVNTYKNLKNFFITFKKLLTSKYGTYKLPNAKEDLVAMSNGQIIYDDCNNDLDNFLKEDDNKVKSDLLESIENNYINKTIDKGLLYALKWETPTTIILLSVENGQEGIFYFEKESYKKLNINLQKQIDDYKKKSLEGL